MIEVRALTKRYGDFTAVDGVSFTIEKGHVYGLLGPNGAGKSTTMNMITGCLSATSGEILIDGENALRMGKAAKKRIGYLPETPPLYPDMTPEEYLLFVAEAKGVRRARAERQVEEAMKLTSLTDVRDRLIANLSKGYRQRVGIAQAMLGNPDVIILDEPTVGLDPKQITEVRDLIRRLGEIKTVILSSHILAEIAAVCDRVMIMSHGRVVANGTVEEITRSKGGSAAVSLTVKGGVSDTVRILEGIGGVQSFTPIRGKDAGTVDVRLYTEAGVDLRETLFRAFAEAGLPLLRLDTEVLTLEDVFLRLTADDPSADADENDEREV